MPDVNHLANLYRFFTTGTRSDSERSETILDVQLPEKSSY